MALSYDLSPMRPDDFQRQRAMRWMAAVADQRAYRDAMSDVALEAQGYQTLATAPAAEVG